MKGRGWMALLLGLACLSGCVRPAAEPPDLPCRVVLEEGEGFTAQTYTGQTSPGGELRFALQLEGMRWWARTAKPRGSAAAKMGRPPSPCGTCGTLPQCPSRWKRAG